jgi:hypothetical protein
LENIWKSFGEPGPQMFPKCSPTVPQMFPKWGTFGEHVPQMFFWCSSVFPDGEHGGNMFPKCSPHTTSQCGCDHRSENTVSGGRFPSNSQRRKLRSDTNSSAIAKQDEAESRSALKHLHTLLDDRIANKAEMRSARPHTHYIAIAKQVNIETKYKSKHKHST